MFDWFFEFLYSISAAICKLIDGVMLCANKLCGVETIKVSGKETDFLTFLFESEEIRLAFVVGCIVGLILVVFFSVLQICRTVAKEKIDESPARIAMNALKTVFIFMCVPAIMLISMWCGNIIVRVMYQATLNGSQDGLGAYLIGAFSKEGTTLPSGVDYTDAEAMWDYFNLKKYNYFFSWLAGIIILFETAKALILFVDRAISIVVLYICAPFSISTNIIDEGSHFKLWRDQVLIKFITGYGTIIALNIYALIVALVSRSDVQFFDNEFVNFVMKILIIIGGAFSLQKVMGLIGNLVQSGAGTQEMQQAAMANSQMGGFIKGIGRAAAKATGLSTLGGVVKGAAGNITKGWSDKLSNKITGGDKNSSQQQQDQKDFKENILSNLESINARLGGQPASSSAKRALEGKPESDSNRNSLTSQGEDNKSSNKNPMASLNRLSDLGSAPTESGSNKKI